MYQIGQWLSQNQWKSKLNWLEIFKLKKNLNRNIWTTYYCLFILFSNTCKQFFCQKLFLVAIVGFEEDTKH